MTYRNHSTTIGSACAHLRSSASQLAKSPPLPSSELSSLRSLALVDPMLGGPFLASPIPKRVEFQFAFLARVKNGMTIAQRKTNADCCERGGLLSLLDGLLDDLWVRGIVRFARCVDFDDRCFLLRGGLLDDGSLLDGLDGYFLRGAVMESTSVSNRGRQREERTVSSSSTMRQNHHYPPPPLLPPRRTITDIIISQRSTQPNTK